jgi:hypothetical protein
MIQKFQNRIGRKHSKFIQSIFLKIEPTGIDLGNIEVKESTSFNQMFTMRKKDKESEYILFYSHLEDTFFITKTTEFTFLTEKKGIRLTGVKKHSFFKTKDVIEMLETLTPLLKNQEYNPLKA